jgi:hypothetical protein
MFIIVFTVPCPEPDQSSPYLPILSLFFLVASFLVGFLPISYMHSSSPPFVLLLDLIILIILGEEYKF